MNRFKAMLGAAVLGCALTSTANAALITYSLSDKGPGAVAPPDYGLRLDGLFGDASSEWTFSFTQGNVQMIVDTTTPEVNIKGTVVGGRDTGGSWAATYNWYLDFTYTSLIINDPATGYWSAPMGPDPFINTMNRGTLKLLSDANVDGIAGSDLNKSLGLSDYKGGDFYLDGGKGPYVSAWLANTDGFISGEDLTDPNSYNRIGACCKDFGFRASKVPEPSPLFLISSVLIGLGATRKYRNAQS